MPAPLYLSQKSQRTVDQPISYFMQQAVENPNIISLAAGLVDAASLPAEEFHAAAEEVLRDCGRARAALQYGTTQGLAPLRDLLVHRLAAADGLTPAQLSLTADDCLITTGSQQLLYLLSEALFDPGDLVITAAPSYFVYQGTLRSMGVRTYAVPSDADGLDTDALAALLRRLNRSELARLRLIYVVDYFDNPTGSTLSLARRQHLLELVRRYSQDHRILIVEDAAYRELRYEGPDLPSLKSFDADNSTVVLVQTFSKACAPGLRLGYAVVPRELREPLLRLKGNHDFGSSNLAQHLAWRLLENGAYDRHVLRLREVYRRKRDCLLQALEQEFPETDQVRWQRPKGGLYVWLRLPEDVPTGPGGSLLPAALEEGVLYVPGEFCYLDDAARSVPQHEIRLCYGVVDEANLQEGVRRLARAFRRVAPRREGCQPGVRLAASRGFGSGS